MRAFAKGLSRSYYKLSFQTRVQVTFVVLIVLAISLTGGGAYWVASDIVESNAKQAGQETIDRSRQVMDERMRHITVSVMTLILSDAYHQMANDVKQRDKSKYYTDLTAMQPLFAQIKLNEPMVHSVLLSTPIGDFFDTANVRNLNVPFVGSDIYKELKTAKNHVWIKGHEDPYFTSRKDVVSFVMHPISETDEIYIIVNVLESSLTDILMSNLNAQNYEMALTDADGANVLSSGLADIRMDNRREADYIVSQAKLTMNDWTLVSFQKRAVILKQLNRIQWIVLWGAASCIVISLFVSRMLVSLLLKPLQSLKTLMKKVERNELSVRFRSKYADEFSLVGLRFNQMLETISNLIATNQTIEEEKRKAEIAALQAQISPHFLYNTLNTIYWKNQLGQSANVGEMVLSLSQMFQLGLNGGKEMTTIDRELAHVEQYMMLQRNSYENLFEYEISLGNESLRSLPILKLMLQPIVENSILHGFKNVKADGIIRISLATNARYLVITVFDNGSGMDEQTASKLLKEPLGTSGGSGNGYALRNINNRLRLYYGAQSSMSVQSRLNVGTVVTLHIPIGGHEDGTNLHLVRD
ncbi:sensor histidine kinase [Cohnella panacarvi]|uniref:sensor histidine kinase n=1 Tax=Cohnella panacarvi TaxID=400776 RepID=UPI00047BB41B|nr:histidine kinase [Cohnella panacarvi]